VTDLEMTRLCAEALGVNPEYRWNPLHDDAQAMALVKKMDLSIDRGGQQTASPWWCARNGTIRRVNADLNRCIVECVAKMWKERGK